MHTLTWLLWVATALVIIGLSTNPLYLVLVLLATVLVFVVWREPTPLARAFPLFLLAGVVLWLGYTLFSVVTVGGARGQTVLFVLPQVQLPIILGGITLGGPATAEDVTWGVARGLRLLVLLAVFGAFNALIDHYRLLRMTPRSLFHAGLAVTIAITFVPQFVRAVSEITEAQRVRGHRFRGPASYMPLVGPLLASSLESSLQLAEALDARGYGRTITAKRSLAWQQVGVIVGLVVLAAGLFAWLYYGASAIAVALLSGGGLALFAALQALGRLVPRTTYRRERWRRRDWIVVLVALGAACVWVAIRLSGVGGLVYNPYPVISAPQFEAHAALIPLALTIPAFLRPRLPEGRALRSHHVRRNGEERTKDESI